MIELLQKIRAVAIGHAVGDALGVPVEFLKRYEIAHMPVTQMEGNGTYNMPKGSWSDDTSMAICALDALSKDKINFDKVMTNFCRWYYSGEYTPTGKVFDVGNSCAMAIERYFKQGLSWKECGVGEERDNGNGSLMRIYPFVLYTYVLKTNVKTKIEIIELACALTHSHPRSKIACGIYAFILWELLDNPTLSSVFIGLNKAKQYYYNEQEFSRYNRIFSENFAGLSDSQIKSTGYVVDTLEAVIWCLLNTKSYTECVLKAVNLGDDTDTVSAIAGSLAGALYGYEAIPLEWRESLLKREYIESICQKAFENLTE